MPELLLKTAAMALAGVALKIAILNLQRVTGEFTAVIQLTDIFDRRIIPRLAERHSRGVAQPGSATALGAVGREFESLHPDQFNTIICL